MSRRIGKDFSKLNSFLKEYSLESYFENELQLKESKAMHGKLYGFMIFCYEFNLQRSQNPTSQFLDETTSDLMLSFFNWIIAGPKKRDSLLRWKPTRRLSHEQADQIFG